METKHGDPLRLTKIDDDIMFLKVLPNPQEKLKSIQNIENREGDILLCSYPKSGTHWMGSLIKKMVVKTLEEDQREKINQQFLGLLELSPLDLIPNAVSPRVMVTHLYPKRYPTFFREGRAKVVLILRNPKDVAVSFYYHLKNAQMMSNKQDWNEYFISYHSGAVPFGSYMDYLKAWDSEIKNNKSLDVEYFYYEELKRNGLECARRLAKHLGVHLDDKELQSVLDECSLKNLKEEDAKQKSDIKKPLVDKNGLSIIYRKGEVADWKNHFTVAQSGMYDETVKESLSGTLFSFQYE